MSSNDHNVEQIRPAARAWLKTIKRKLLGKNRRSPANTNTEADLIRSSNHFDAEWYVSTYPDVKDSSLEPAQHYLLFGGSEGRNPSEHFDTAFYLERYPDVAESGMNPLLHYVLHGKTEGRHPKESKVDLLGDKVWSGHAPSAIKSLYAAANDEHLPVSERNMACWHIARWVVFQGDFTEGLTLSRRMAALVPEQRMAKFRVLLEANCLLKLKKPDDASDLLLEYLLLEPSDADARLMLANTYVDDEQRLSCINEMFTRLGYQPIGKRHRDLPLSIRNIRSTSAKCASDIPREGQHEKVSIIMPVYAAEGCIEVAIRSLLEQTWQNLEIIAVDDCSPDDTLSVLNRLASEDARVKVVQQTINQGAYPARNRGLREATGDYITTHDADDWSHPQKIEQQITLLRKTPNAKGVILNWVRVTDDLYFTINWRPSNSIIHYSHSSFLLERAAAAEIGDWDEVRIGADTEYIWRAQHRFGKGAIVHSSVEAPMAFALDDESSLTRTKMTHVSTVYFGLRHVYREISRWYHKKGFDPTQKTRIPLAMKQRDVREQMFDKVIVADFTNKRGSRRVLTMLCGESHRRGERIGLLHWPHFSSRYQRFCDSYFETLHEGLATPIVFGDNVVVDQVIVSDAELLFYPVVAAPDFLRVNTVKVLSDNTVSGGDSEALMEQAQKYSKALFSKEFSMEPLE